MGVFVENAAGQADVLVPKVDVDRKGTAGATLAVRAVADAAANRLANRAIPHGTAGATPFVDFTHLPE